MRHGCGCGARKSKVENTKAYKCVKHPVPRPQGPFMVYLMPKEACKLMNTMEYPNTLRIQIRKCKCKENSKKQLRQECLLVVTGKTCSLFSRCSRGAAED